MGLKDKINKISAVGLISSAAIIAVRNCFGKQRTFRF